MRGALAHNLCHKSAENKRQPLVKSTLTRGCCLLNGGYLILSQAHCLGVYGNNGCTNTTLNILLDTNSIILTLITDTH